MQLDVDKDGQLLDIAWQLSSVAGNQTVPRAECVGAAAAFGMAKASSIGRPILHVDAGCVVKGFPKLSDRLTASNADVWAAIQEQASQVAVEIHKVKAHTTAEQVARGEASWDDYAGKAVADAFAKTAAALAELPSLVHEQVDSTERQAFLLCMRIALVEELLDQNKSDIAEGEVQQATPLITAEEAAAQVASMTHELTHQLVRLPSGKCRCVKCGVSLNGSQASKWFAEACSGSACTPIAAPAIEVNIRRCSFTNLLSEQNRQSRINKKHSATSRALLNRGLANYLKSCPSLQVWGSFSGVLPDWVQMVSPTHIRLVHGGGFVCCLRCGALAASHNLRSGLFEGCPAASLRGWQLPEGSKGRLQRVRQGEHPEGTAASSWPDGRSADTVVQMRAVARARHDGDVAPLVELLAEPDEPYDELADLAVEEQRKDDRLAEIIGVHHEDFEEAGPEGQLKCAALAGYSGEECRAGITRRLARPRWPAAFGEESVHHHTAQLLAWPSSGHSSLVGFSRSVLTLVECIDASQERLRSGDCYPEEVALFSDVPDLRDFRLAATFVAKVQEELWELGEASSYVAEQLQMLADSV